MWISTQGGDRLSPDGPCTKVCCHLMDLWAERREREGLTEPESGGKHWEWRKVLQGTPFPIKEVSAEAPGEASAEGPYKRPVRGAPGLGMRRCWRVGRPGWVSWDLRCSSRDRGASAVHKSVGASSPGALPGDALLIAYRQAWEILHSISARSQTFQR